MNNINQESRVQVNGTLPDQEETQMKQRKSSKLLILLAGLFIFLIVGIGIFVVIMKKTGQTSQNHSKAAGMPTIAITSPTTSSIQPKDYVFKGVNMFPSYRDKQVWLYQKVPFEQLQRYDVVVFNNPSDKRLMAKRVIGLPNDSVMIKNGKVYLNNQILDESKYVLSGQNTTEGAFLHEGITVTVPQGNLFVMGDNRPYSSDSREWGFVPKDSIIGKLTTQIQSLDEAEDKCSCWDVINSICASQVACQ